MDSRLSEVIVCPVCKGPVTLSSGGRELCCARCALAFPIVDGVPVMLAGQAREMSREEAEKSRPTAVQGQP